MSQSPPVLYSLIFAALKTFEKLRKVIFMPGELFFSFCSTPVFEVGEQQYISSPSAITGWEPSGGQSRKGENTSPGGCFIRRVGVSTCSRSSKELQVFESPGMGYSPAPFTSMNIEPTQREGAENTYAVSLLVSDLKLLHIPVWKTLLDLE